MSAKRVLLASISARLLWDGRVARGRFIPGIVHFQGGVLALRRAARGGDGAAAGRLAEIDVALAGGEAAVNRWAKGVAAFPRETFGAGEPGPPGWADAEARRVRIRAGQTQRLAELIAGFDGTCAATAAATALARARGVFNPHHAAIGERARMIRAIVDLGYAGGLACRCGSRRGRGRRPSRLVGE